MSRSTLSHPSQGGTCRTGLLSGNTGEALAPPGPGSIVLCSLILGGDDGSWRWLLYPRGLWCHFYTSAHSRRLLQFIKRHKHFCYKFNSVYCISWSALSPLWCQGSDSLLVSLPFLSFHGMCFLFTRTRLPFWSFLFPLLTPLSLGQHQFALSWQHSLHHQFAFNCL